MSKNTVAFDKASARHYVANGHLIVDGAVIKNTFLMGFFNWRITSNK